MLEVKNLCAFYKSSNIENFKNEKKIIFENLNFSLKENSFVALCGKNGAGKSTLLNLLDGIIPEGVFVTGEVLLDKKNIFKIKRKEIAQKISYLVQNENPVWNISVEEFIETGFYSTDSYFSFSKSEREEKIKSALTQFGILDLAKKKILNISGGEFQKCRLARATVQQNDILLFDEPVENLDLPFQNNFLKNLKSLKNSKNKKTILFSIHDINLASIYADDFILFSEKNIIQGSRQEIFTKENLSRAYDCDVKIFIHPELKKEQVLFL